MRLTNADILLYYSDLELDPIAHIETDEEFIAWLNIIDETIEDGLSINQAIDTLYLVIKNLVEKEHYEWCILVQNKITLLYQFDKLTQLKINK